MKMIYSSLALERNKEIKGIRGIRGIKKEMDDLSSFVSYEIIEDLKKGIRENFNVIQEVYEEKCLDTAKSIYKNDRYRIFFCRIFSENIENTENIENIKNIKNIENIKNEKFYLFMIEPEERWMGYVTRVEEDLTTYYNENNENIEYEKPSLYESDLIESYIDKFNKCLYHWDTEICLEKIERWLDGFTCKYINYCKECNMFPSVTVNPSPYCMICEKKMMVGEEDCCICLSNHSSVWVKLQCGHKMHNNCLFKIKGHIKTCEEDYSYIRKCPICRTETYLENNSIIKV